MTFDAALFLKTLTHKPGVYHMIDTAGEVIYVGKARDLKKRISSYFSRQKPNIKVASLVKQIQHIEVIVTNSENEALLLENTLIKKYKPRYNVLFRDDKSYPYIFLSQHKEYPRLDFHRGSKTEKGLYFGPYPSSSAVRESLSLLQKLFHIRQCDDIFFRNRTRPCLQYFIKRCSAPCVGFIDPATYQNDVKHVRLFLEGKNQEVVTELVKRMETASKSLDYEHAALYRDQITKIRYIQERQHVAGDAGEVDVISIATAMDTVCVQLLYVRGGRLIGNKAFFSKGSSVLTEEEIISSFITQHYLNTTLMKDSPTSLMTSYALSEKKWFEEVLSTQSSHRVKIITTPRSRMHKGWLKIAINSAQQALASHLSNKESVYRRFEALQETFGQANIPQRIECVDVSHTLGEATVASCVVFDINGPVKSHYRRYNITGITPGDDYAAIDQIITRRYTKIKQGEGILPDILFIDGGKGQLHQAENALKELQVSGVLIVGIAKGEARKPGLETLHVAGQITPVILKPDSSALHLIQQIRDEAHRFAIVGHRQKRAKTRKVSFLENIPGIGPKKRRELLNRMGGLQEIKRASVDELTKVPGISPALAEKIYKTLHGSEE